MRVKIGNTWYDAHEVPICIEFNPQDKKNIESMDKGCTRYAIFPDKMAKSMTNEDMLRWME